MRAVVTGGSGFIGSRLISALRARGDDVLNMDIRAQPPVDVTDAGRAEAMLCDFRPDVIFHLAAQISVPGSMADPANDCSVNVTGTVAMLEAAMRSGANRFVFTSSGGAIYGEGLGHTEESPPIPLSPYGQSKLAAEGYLNLYARRGLSTCALRLANVYGPGQDANGEAGVVAIFANTEDPVIYGDGSQQRDFVHVDDVVSALLAAADSDHPGPLNIGGGSVTDINGLARILGHESPRHLPARPGDIHSSSLAPTRALTALNWTPTIAVTDGMAQMRGGA